LSTTGVDRKKDDDLSNVVGQKITVRAQTYAMKQDAAGFAATVGLLRSALI
jgi:hypothetical protein